MKKLFIAAIFACVCVMMASCNYVPKITPIEGSGYATFTDKVDGQELLGVQTTDGAKIIKAVYADIRYEGGYFIAQLPNYGDYALFDADGNEVMSDVKKSVCAYSANVTDSLGHFIFGTLEGDAAGIYWLFPTGEKIVGPRSDMHLYPLEQVIVYKQDGKFGVLSYGNQELSPLGEQLCFATRTDVVRQKGKREKVETPVIYVSDKGKDNWQKFSRLSGAPLGKLDAQDIDLINKSAETMLDDVYAVRPKK
ncbi:MAG: hypothetical protein IJ689_07875 [Alphaproteobacteria bacterium]|nr:hypothetical protein [Alphaproteobacteria bacterium]MBR1649493.1 hypothetical protein [Alphaproteobacteria bacterium]